MLFSELTNIRIFKKQQYDQNGQDTQLGMKRNKLTIKIVFSFLLDIKVVADAPALVFIMIFRSFWNSAVF